MQTLEDVLELVRMAREHIECGLADDARWMLELVEGDLGEPVGVESANQRGQL